MSKHQKEVRRERKKTDRARRRAYSKWTGAALAAIVAVAVGTAAEASPIRFDNPPGAGHYEWFGGGPDEPIGLNITLSASDQTGEPLEPGAFHQTNNPDHTFISGGYDGEVEKGGPSDYFLVGLDAGVLIPSGLPWGSGGYTNYPGFDSPLPYDEPTYLGVRFDLGSSWQYAWIGVVFSSADYTVDAFAWGYETEVGVPIAAGAPEPGSLALLAFGAVAATARRRQRGN